LTYQRTTHLSARIYRFLQGSFIKVLSYQLERNAEKVDEKTPESLIDVRA
jgi:hypothetical protein